MAISSEERTVLLRLAGSAPPPEHPLCKDGCGGGAIELCQGQGNPDNVGRYYQKPVRRQPVERVSLILHSAKRIVRER